MRTWITPVGAAVTRLLVDRTLERRSAITLLLVGVGMTTLLLANYERSLGEGFRRNPFVLGLPLVAWTVSEFVPRRHGWLIAGLRLVVIGFLAVVATYLLFVAVFVLSM